MSGIEAAGLVLGAIPIVIWGLQNYQVTREIWRRSRSKALLVDRLINALQEQRILIELDLQILLRAADFEDDEIAGLETSNCYDLLLDKRLAEPLIRYLGRVYGPYRGALERCERIVIDIAQSIGGLTSQAQSQQAQGSYLLDLINLHANSTKTSRWRQTSQKFKFALEKEELDQKISELDMSTSMLSRLRVAGGLLQDDDQLPSSGRIRRLTGFLNKAQRYTSDLYSAIRESCPTSCHTLHRFKLYLEDQSAPLLRKKPQISFRIEALPVPTPAELRAWYYAHVETLEEEYTGTKTKSALEPHSKEIPTVNFTPTESREPPKCEVQDLCATFTKASSSNKVLKLYLAERGRLASCHVPIDPQAQSNRSTSLVAGALTLETIIKKAYESREYSVRWSLTHRMVLAYRLASCLLQFQSTPWLEDSWKKKSIFFPNNAVADPSGKDIWQFDANSPFIIHDFQSSPVPTLATHTTKARSSLLDLGILLLEIWHVTPSEVYAQQEGLLLDTTYGARYEVASRWLNHTADNILPFYLDPVCRCIEGTFASSAPVLQWNDRQFQSSVCESLVKPLWDNCSSKSHQRSTSFI